jgi:trehalose synthase
MSITLSLYESAVGSAAILQLRQLAQTLADKRIVHVNSTRSGGGVAEILVWLVDLMNDLGLHASWEVIEGNDPFFKVTKAFHNGMQGNPTDLSHADRRAYEETNARNAERLRPILEEADFVFIHDPQPAAQLGLTPKRRGKWIWRCHIDASHPHRPVWKYLRSFVTDYDASVFSMPQFAQSLPHPEFIIAPSIDPLSPKNLELSSEEIDRVRAEYGLDPERPVLVQISRFDRFKDPVGVIRAYKIARRFAPVQLVLAGGGATDDPEGAAVLEEVQEEAEGDPDIHILFLPGDAHHTVNALQRIADIVLQKSTKEGFGLTVTEALWKAKPVVGGDTGGIRLQVFNHHTGFLVNSPEGAAHRIRYLLQHRSEMLAMGKKGREFVRENFLLTRHLREYLTLMLGLTEGLRDLLIAG